MGRSPVSLSPEQEAPAEMASTSVEGGSTHLMTVSGTRSSDLWMVRRKQVALPPHLQPNPITGACPRPSRLLAFSTTMLVWTLLGSACAWLHLLGLKRQAGFIKGEPPTVSVIFDQMGSFEPAQAQTPAGGGSGSSQAPPASESISTSTLSAAQAQAPEMQQLSIVSVPEFPLETNLLPTQPTRLAPGGGGHRYGTASSGSGSGSSSQRTGWGDGTLLSGLGRGMTVTLDSLDVMHQEIPVYPEKARYEHVSGEVIVDVVIDERGIPRQVELVRSDHPLLVSEVMRVTPKWRFAPVVLGANRVRANFRICFRFVIEEL